MEQLLLVIEDFESLDGFIEVGQVGLGYIGSLVNYLGEIPKMDEGNN